jgi:hypothetical protein
VLRQSPTATLAAATLAAVLAMVSSTGCTPAPSGRLDTAPLHEPTVQPSPPSTVTDLPTFDTSTAVGELAEGFPQDLVPLPPEAELIASSAETANGLVRISLNASSPHTTEEVMAEVGAPLAVAGFTQETPDATSGLTALTAWTRRTDRPEGPIVETLLVGVLDDGVRRLVSVSGTVQGGTPG